MAQLSMQALGQELAKPRQGLASLTETRTETVVSAAARLREIAGGETDEAMAQLFDDKIAEVCEMHTEVEAATQAIQQVCCRAGVHSGAEQACLPSACCAAYARRAALGKPPPARAYTLQAVLAATGVTGLVLLLAAVAGRPPCLQPRRVRSRPWPSPCR